MLLLSGFMRSSCEGEGLKVLQDERWHPRPVGKRNQPLCVEWQRIGREGTV